MELDEYIFEKVAKYFRRRKNSSSEADEYKISLEEIRSRLIIISRAFTGLPIEIFQAEREGGYKNNNYFLPASVSLFDSAEENLSFYFYRTLYLSIQQQLNLNWNGGGSHTLIESQQQANFTAKEVLCILQKDYPIAFELHENFRNKFIANHKSGETLPDFTWLYGKWMNNNPETKSVNELENFGDTIKAAMKQDAVTTIKAKAVEEITSVEVDKKQQEDYVLTHNFEKVETAEEFEGGWRDFDGDDDLEKHQDALDELNMKFTVRVDDMVHSVYQADFIENASISESKEKEKAGICITYPEWDYSKRRYRENFCKVFPEKQLATNVSYYQNTIKEHHTVLSGLRKMLTSVNNKLSQHRRQPDGNEFDLDALTDLYCDVHSCHTPSDKIYLSNRKQEKDLAILLLLDSSLSSDGYSNGNRVIDVEKQVSILFGEIMQEFQINFSVATFFSKTRNYLSYNILKDFSEPWSHAKYKIGAAEPGGYTRIGAALRHAGNELKNQSAKNKWIILLSDGKPNDYDKYEGKYGISDVKQALRELNENRINSYALAIEAQARYYLPQMFGQNHYRILTSPNELLQSMVLLFEKIRNKS
ncbi:MAG: VWA domain-containing protein [Bacteroidetes bacterium]|nr:VWA domain-containing protein [Bacteroidota bacterium]